MTRGQRSEVRGQKSEVGLSRNAESGMALEVEENPFNHVRVSKVEQMEAELRNLSQAELRQIREWLDDLIEDELEFTPEFENSIQRSERDMAAGKAARVRELKHA